VDSYSSKRIRGIPETKLSRGQIIKLLGQPTLKCGFIYYWYCGFESKPVMDILGPPGILDPSQQFYGFLTVTFDPGEMTRYLQYNVDNRKWE
jgi:hypothetical protein